MFHDIIGRSMRMAMCGLALLATPALAHPGDGAGVSKAKPVVTAAPGTCTAAEMAVITEAFAEARRRLQQATAFIVERPDDPHVRRWFGSTPPKLILLNLQIIAQGVENPARYTMQCHHAVGCAERPFAYALPYAGTLGFCASFFRSPDSGRDARFGIVVHEVSHIVIRTRDAAYFPENTEKLAHENPAIAATNAESYEHFVEFLPVR
jgi:hypothetical protein